MGVYHTILFSKDFDYLDSDTQAKIFRLQWEINIFKINLPKETWRIYEHIQSEYNPLWD